MIRTSSEYQFFCNEHAVSYFLYMGVHTWSNKSNTYITYSSKQLLSTQLSTRVRKHIDMLKQVAHFVYAITSMTQLKKSCNFLRWSNLTMWFSHETERYGSTHQRHVHESFDQIWQMQKLFSCWIGLNCIISYHPMEIDTFWYTLNQMWYKMNTIV